MRLSGAPVPGRFEELIRMWKGGMPFDVSFPYREDLATIWKDIQNVMDKESLITDVFLSIPLGAASLEDDKAVVMAAGTGTHSLVRHLFAWDGLQGDQIPLHFAGLFLGLDSAFNRMKLAATGDLPDYWDRDIVLSLRDERAEDLIKLIEPFYEQDDVQSWIDDRKRFLAFVNKISLAPYKSAQAYVESLGWKAPPYSEAFYYLGATNIFPGRNIPNETYFSLLRNVHSGQLRKRLLPESCRFWVPQISRLIEAEAGLPNTLNSNEIHDYIGLNWIAKNEAIINFIVTGCHLGVEPLIKGAEFFIEHRTLNFEGTELTYPAFYQDFLSKIRRCRHPRITEAIKRFQSSTLSDHLLYLKEAERHLPHLKAHRR